MEPSIITLDQMKQAREQLEALGTGCHGCVNADKIINDVAPSMLDTIVALKDHLTAVLEECEGYLVHTYGECLEESEPYYAVCDSCGGKDNCGGNLVVEKCKAARKLLNAMEGSARDATTG